MVRKKTNQCFRPKLCGTRIKIQVFCQDGEHLRTNGNIKNKEQKQFEEK